MPAYNEAQRLPATVAATVAYLEQQPWSSRVVVVDNGSSDDTARVDPVGRRPVRAGARRRDRLRAAGQGRRGPPRDADQRVAVRRLLRCRPRHAGRDARRHAWSCSSTARRRSSARATHPARRCCAGSRSGRRLGGAVFRRLTHTLVSGVRDTQCGFKFFDRDAVSRALAQCRTTGFAFDVELLRRIQADGGSIVEIPVAWTDDPRSTFRPIADGAARASRRCCSWARVTAVSATDRRRTVRAAAARRDAGAGAQLARRPTSTGRRRRAVHAPDRPAVGRGRRARHLVHRRPPRAAAPSR